MTAAPTPTTIALLRRLFDALDFEALGEVYCDSGGPAFWADRREPAIELGAVWARELAARLPAGGRSLYVGAGVAELPALLTEALDLGRECVAANLRAVECDVLNAGLAAVGVSGVRIEPGDARELAARAGGFDHVSLVSVLDDPETFPWINAVTYGNVDPVHLDLDAFARERESVRGLVAALLASLRLPATITTTVEEVGWILEGAGDRLAVEADDTVVESAIVGDAIGFLRCAERAT